MTQAADVDPLLEPPDELFDELEELVEGLAGEDGVDGVLELEDSFGVLVELLELSLEEDVLRESLR